MKISRRKLAAALALLIFIALSLEAQRAPSPAPSDTKFSSRTELVLVPVIVHDRSRKHVGGIDRDKFTLLDNGKPRPVQIFEEVHTSTSVSMPKRQANEFGNYLTASNDSRRVTILLLDLMETRFEEQTRARKRIVDYISKNLSPDEPTSLLVLSPRGLKQVHHFTTDTALLIEAVNKLRNEITTSSNDPTLRALTSGLTSSGGGSGMLKVEEELAAVRAAIDSATQGLEELKQQGIGFDLLRALELVAHGYAGVPGRKSLVLISGGVRWPNDDSLGARDFRDRADRVFKILAAANIAVYPADVEGLVAPFLGTPPGQGLPNPLTSAPVIRSLDTRAEYHDFFRTVAGATGGRPCINNNDIADCLQRAANDSERYYVLGFYLPAAERNTGQHKLSVKLQANYSDLRYREFYNTSEQQEYDSPNAALRAVYSSPIDYTELPFDVVVEQIVSEGDKRRVHLALSLPPNSFYIDPSQNNLVEIEFSSNAFGPNDKSVNQDSKTVKGNLRSETVDRLSKEGLTQKLELELPPGTYQLKCAVRDDLTGKIGSVIAPLVVK